MKLHWSWGSFVSVLTKRFKKKLNYDDWVELSPINIRKIWKLNLTFRRPGNCSKFAKEIYLSCAYSWRLLPPFCVLPSWVIGQFVWIVRSFDFHWDLRRFLRRLVNFHWLAGVYPCPNIIFEIFYGISFIWIKSLFFIDTISIGCQAFFLGREALVGAQSCAFMF